MLADKAGVSRSVVYLVEAGEPASMEAAVRLASALGLRLDLDLVDPRRRVDGAVRLVDPVHSAMGELEAGHLRPLGYRVGLDEPYRHYQFAGRADFVAWDDERRAFLHLENRTRFPNFGEMAGACNSKRAYLGPAIAARLEVEPWASETHVIVALWSAEVLHALRLRPDSFRSICPDPPVAFAALWSGRPPATGVTSSLIVLDPTRDWPPETVHWLGRRHDRSPPPPRLRRCGPEAVVRRRLTSSMRKRPAAAHCPVAVSRVTMAGIPLQMDAREQYGAVRHRPRASSTTAFDVMWKVVDGVGLKSAEIG